MSTPARPALFLSRIGWRETTVLLVAAGLVPFLVHLLPWSGHRPLGVYVLPVFWTTFLAVYFRGALTGMLVGLVTPLINLLVTGLPVSLTVGSMSLEVIFFVLGASWLVRRWPGLMLVAPLAWVAAKGLAIGVQYFIPAFAEAEYPWQHLARSTQNGLAGLVVLAAINLLLVKFYPKSDEWEKE
jgi:hypothetical protein